MQRAKVENREFEVEFSTANQGFRLSVMEYHKTENDWRFLQDFYNTIFINQTQFEALGELSSEIFGEAVYAEDFAQQLDIDMRFSDDIDCRDCDYFGNYEEMQEQDGEYLCLDCMEEN